MSDRASALQSLSQARKGVEVAKAFLMTEVVRRNIDYRMFITLTENSRNLLRGVNLAIEAIERELPEEG